jgi:hypothetical protein
MKTENLEALLIDRAMGELPTATAELLEEYLGSNPALLAKASELSGILRQAGEAMHADGSYELRPFPREAIAHEQRVVHWRRGIFKTMKLAACVALGLSLGWFGKPVREASALPPAVLVKPQHNHAAPEAKVGSDESFWSLARYEARRKAAEPSDRVSRHEPRMEIPLTFKKLEEKL